MDIERLTDRIRVNSLALAKAKKGSQGEHLSLKCATSADGNNQMMRQLGANFEQPHMSFIWPQCRRKTGFMDSHMSQLKPVLLDVCSN
jgi:hypothetical protein